MSFFGIVGLIWLFLTAKKLQMPTQTRLKKVQRQQLVEPLE